MDYMREINAFYDWLDTNPISEAARNLWHALMHTANRAGWITEFAVAVSVLEAKTGMSRPAVYRARNVLKEYGRISFRNRGGNQSSIYVIIPLVSHTETQGATQSGHKAQRKAYTRREHNTSYPSDTRKTKTKTKTKTDARDCGVVLDPFDYDPNTDNADAATDAIRQVQAVMLDDDWPERDKCNLEAAEDCVQVYSLPWVLEAMSRVRDDRGLRNWRYVRGILRSWAKSGGMDTPSHSGGGARPQTAPRDTGFFVEIDTGKVVEMGQEAFDAEKRHYSLRVDLSMQELAPNRILVSRKGVRSCGTTTQMPRSP